MIDWRPIEEAKFSKGDEELFYAIIPGSDRSAWWGHGQVFGDCEYILLDGNKVFVRLRDGRIRHEFGYIITHYAHVAGPDAPNPIREVYEKYQRDTRYLSDIDILLDSDLPIYKIALDLWRAIKAALNISQPVTEESTNDE